MNESKSRALITCTIQQWIFHDAKYTVCAGSVTKNFVRLRIIILGQKISETFCPLLKFFVRSLYIAINARGRELCLTVILTKMP